MSRWKFAFGVWGWAIARVVRAIPIADFRAEISSALKLREIGRLNVSGIIGVLDAFRVCHAFPGLKNENFRQRAEDGGPYLDSLIRC